MNSSCDSSTDRILRTAAWLYVVPRAATGLLVLSALVLALFMVIATLALAFLHRLGG